MGAGPALPDTPDVFAPAPSPAPRRVLIAGGGIAGIEAALAVRAFTGPASHVVVIDPGRRFTVPGTATARAFGMGTGVDLRLADVVHRAGATLVNGRVASVDPGRHMVTLDGGEVVTYDALVLAVGARPVPAVPGALTFAGAPDIDAVRGMIGDIGRRALRGAGVEMAVVVPPGCGWPLAAYELALMTREHLELHDVADAVSICIVTSEEAPLGLFGPDASATVARSLARARIDVRTGVAARRWRAGCLELADGGTIWADRAIALPVYRGPAVDGLPADDEGFIRAAPDGRIPGAPDVWAVGDGTTNPVKQGGIACQQADAAAAGIAADFGTPVDDAPAVGGLSGWMWDGRQGRWLASGDAEPSDPAGAAPVWPVAKIGGRFLAPFLHALVADGGAAGPVGVPS
jgi:sulfide:quinone oxidoreductase